MNENDRVMIAEFMSLCITLLKDIEVSMKTKTRLLMEMDDIRRMFRARD